jgi:hypothetical protein
MQHMLRNARAVERSCEQYSLFTIDILMGSYDIIQLENPLGFLDASGRMIYWTKLAIKLPWQCFNIVWLPWKPNLVVLVTLCGCHGNLVWLL